ncbi:MAG: peptidylprolyl isomerase [Gemmatimonadota bacterium]
MRSLGSPSFLLLAAAALAACGTEAPPALTVGPVSFTEDELLGLSPARRESLALLTAFGLAVADSAVGELGEPLMAREREDRLLETLAAEKILEDAGVDDAVLKARYLTNPEYELTVRHILFLSERWETPERRAEARAKAERALELLRNGADFAETAARLSEEPGAEGRQGLLRPGREGAWVDEFWQAASALEVGEVSPVVETRYGFHILRLEDRKVVPFEESRARVVREVAPQVGDPTAYLEKWKDPQARSLALEEARQRGIRLAPEEEARIRRAWEDKAAGWAAELGFRPGMSARAVHDAALAALGNPAQGAVIARRELAALGDLLLARYPVRQAAADSRGS